MRVRVISERLSFPLQHSSQTNNTKQTKQKLISIPNRTSPGQYLNNTTTNQKSLHVFTKKKKLQPCSLKVRRLNNKVGMRKLTRTYENLDRLILYLTIPREVNVTNYSLLIPAAQPSEWGDGAAGESTTATCGLVGLTSVTKDSSSEPCVRVAAAPCSPPQHSPSPTSVRRMPALPCPKSGSFFFFNLLLFIHL